MKLEEFGDLVVWQKVRQPYPRLYPVFYTLYSKIKIFLELSKVKISLLAALSTATGFIIATEELPAEIIIPTLGIFLLACGASGLNQYQDRKIDALMDRTKLRPIPSGKVEPFRALCVSLCLILSGSLILLSTSNLAVLCLGIFAVLWYNGVYTYLKRRSTFAVLPGALIGAIPPIIGWVAGGGAIFEPKILAIAFFFFIWQVPHFWLFLLHYGYDYERAGLPSLTRIFSPEQLKRLTFIWIVATAVAYLLIPILGTVNSNPVNFCLLAAALWLVWNATNLLRADTKNFSYKRAFREINIYALLVISLLSVDKLIIPDYKSEKGLTHGDSMKQGSVSCGLKKVHP